MWTRTLSTTISTSPLRACGSSLAMLGLSHAEPVERPGRRRLASSGRPNHSAHGGAQNEATDVSEQRTATRRARRTERRETVDQPPDEPQADTTVCGDR